MLLAHAVFNRWIAPGKVIPGKARDLLLYFPRKITSPWPTIWSFSHTRYL